MTEPVYDLAIVGGGVNGCGVARDAAGRGLGVFLCERSDLAAATSSASTKLIHGGLRYLEQSAFRLVRESLREREVLLRAAPHLIRPMRFVLPIEAGLRPAWLIRLGLFVYDHLGGRECLPPTRALDLRADPAGRPLRPGFGRAFEYSDCWVDDARLVVLNALDARERGATIRTRTECTGAERRDGLWRLTLHDHRSGERRQISACALVNATGPWVGRFLSSALGRGTRPAWLRPTRLRLVRGSHIVVPRLFAHDRAYVFQNADRRIVFALPYETDFTLIGTTEVDHDGDPGAAAITAAERDYLCAAASARFARPVRGSDVVWTFSGVRPLHDDGASAATMASRDYVLDLDAPAGGAPLLNVIGGKITTYRRLAEQALDALAPALGGIAGPWTREAPLPGGDFPVEDFEARLAELRAAHPYLPAAQARRLMRAYGTRAGRILAGARRWSDLGRDFGSGLTEAELDHLRREELAETAEDVLWRRSKLGLRMTPDQVERLRAHMAAHDARRAAE